jgi:CLIP-associating protein 1/2
VAVNTCLLYSELVIALETTFDQVCELVLNNLLKMAGVTKKLVAQLSQTTITTILKHTSAQPRTIPHMLWCSLQDKTAQTRVYASGHIKTYIEVHASKAKHVIETSGALDALVNCVKRALSDHNPGVRENARQAYWLLNAVWKDKGTAIMAGLDPNARKQLERACPDPTLLPGSTDPAPPTKKSSVAAVIAASRAKAKAIAIDPPTLRHQATSTARTTTSPKRPLSPSLSNSSVGSPPRSRPVVLSSHTRTATNNSTTSRSPRRDPPSSQHTATVTPPPLHSFDSVRRRTPTTSPALSNTPSSPTFRRAVSTALPHSPPPSSHHLPPPLTPPKLEARLGPTRSSIANWSELIDDESLLVATTVPIPDDDSDFEDDTNPITFSSPFEMFPPAKTKSSPVTPSFTTSSMDEPKHQMLHSMSSSSFSTHSPPATTPQPIVEDAMRARAEQAASAADRLLELVDQDLDDDNTILMDLDENGGPHTANGSLLLRTPTGERNGRSHGRAIGDVGDNVHIATTLPLRMAKQQVPMVTDIWGGRVPTEAPRTPANDRGNRETRDQRGAAIMKQAALLLDSPVTAKSSGLVAGDTRRGAGSTGSVLDLLREKKTGRDWWVKRMTCKIVIRRHLCS